MEDTPDHEASQHVVTWWLQALFLGMFWGVSGRLSPARASAFGRRVMGWVGPKSSKHADVLANLHAAFPDKSPAEIQALGRRMWASFGSTLAEYPHLRTLGSMEEDNPHLEIRNLSGLDDLREQAPFIFISAHLANWELMPFVIRRLCGSVNLLYNPQKNPRLEAMIQGQREAIECRYIPVKNAVHGLYRSLRHGDSVALLMDYRVKGGDLIPFFGVPATTTTAPAWLAAKTGCGILPMGIERLGDARYRVTLRPPLYTAQCGKPSRETIEAFTGVLNKEIEALIQTAPGQWLCTKRRWPRKFLKKA